MWMNQLDYLRSERHPAYQLLTVHSTLLNEEPGEVSLSQLARLQTSVHQTSNINVTTDNFSLMTLTKRTSAVFRTDPGKRTTASGYREIDIEGAEVAIAIAFFKGIIRKLLTAQFRHYTGSPDSWTNSVVAQRGAGVMEVKPPRGFIQH